MHLILKNGIYVEGTAEAGGHSKEILQNTRWWYFVCIDRDIEAINKAKEVLKDQRKK